MPHEFSELSAILQFVCNDVIKSALESELLHQYLDAPLDISKCIRRETLHAIFSIVNSALRIFLSIALFGRTIIFCPKKNKILSYGHQWAKNV